MDIELDLLFDGFVAVEAVVGGADVDAAVVAGGRGVRDGEAAHALRAVGHFATLLQTVHISSNDGENTDQFFEFILFLPISTTLHKLSALFAFIKCIDELRNPSANTEQKTYALGHHNLIQYAYACDA